MFHLHHNSCSSLHLYETTSLPGVVHNRVRHLEGLPDNTGAHASFPQPLEGLTSRLHSWNLASLSFLVDNTTMAPLCSAAHYSQWTDPHRDGIAHHRARCLDSVALRASSAVADRTEATRSGTDATWRGSSRVMFPRLTYLVWIFAALPDEPDLRLLKHSVRCAQSPAAAPHVLSVLPWLWPDTLLIPSGLQIESVNNKIKDSVDGISLCEMDSKSNLM